MRTLQISQELLKQYKQLHEQEKKCRIQREALRDQLVEMLHHGAAVEKGKLNARLQECSKVTLSKAKVVESFGQEQYDWLRSHVAPTLQTQLRIEERAAKKSCSPKAMKYKETCLNDLGDDDWA